jgi:hypothetical protein
MKDRGLKKQLRGNERINNSGMRRQLHPRIEMMLYEIFGGRIARRVVVTPSWLRKIRNWTLWRGRPPPKRKKISCTG